jgi:hypothetical protein
MSGSKYYKPSKSLFHYTTAAGLLGIVKTQTLWATHANFLNDTAECRLLTSLLGPAIAADFRNLVPRLTALGAFKPEILDVVRGNGLDTEAEKVASIALRAIENISPIYITSFCMHRADSTESEHGLLSQWRGYGLGGFAIEFDELELDKLTNAESGLLSYQGMITRKVEYEDHAKAAQLERFAGLAATALKVAFLDKAPKLAAQPEIAAILGNREIGEYISAFMETLPFLKSPQFSEENEYRIVAMATRPGQEKAENDARDYAPVAFRCGPNGALIPYIELFATQKARLPIKKIIIGPHREQDNQQNAVSLLLKQFGVVVPVVKSSTTLRA